MRLPRVAVVVDLREEQWHAMDLAAEMLLRNLKVHEAGRVDASEVRFPMSPRLTRLPLVGRTVTARTADRILNRVCDYPRWLRSRLDEIDLFHIIDHSYAHLVHGLPAERTGVLCHDIDAFLSVVDPARRRTT